MQTVTANGGSVSTDKPVHVETRDRFQVSAEDLWPLVSDTPRLNRAIGLPAVHYKVTPNEAGGTTIVGEYRLAGIPYVRWTEQPFEWQEGRRYLVERRYHWGPVDRVRGGLELTPTDGGTE